MLRSGGQVFKGTSHVGTVKAFDQLPTKAMSYMSLPQSLSLPSCLSSLPYSEKVKKKKKIFQKKSGYTWQGLDRITE